MWAAWKAPVLDRMILTITPIVADLRELLFERETAEFHHDETDGQAEEDFYWRGAPESEKAEPEEGVDATEGEEPNPARPLVNVEWAGVAIDLHAFAKFAQGQKFIGLGEWPDPDGPDCETDD